jgi:hypothetical protein
MWSSVISFALFCSAARPTTPPAATRNGIPQRNRINIAQITHLLQDRVMRRWVQFAASTVAALTISVGWLFEPQLGTTAVRALGSLIESVAGGLSPFKDDADRRVVAELRQWLPPGSSLDLGSVIVDKTNQSLRLTDFVMRTDDGNALTVKRTSLEGMRPLGGRISEVDRIIAHEVMFRKADGRSIQFESLVISKPDLTNLHALISDARGLIAGVTRLAAEIERDPTRFLFGEKKNT